MPLHVGLADLAQQGDGPAVFHRQMRKRVRHLRDDRPDDVEIWGEAERLGPHGSRARLRLLLPTGTLSALGLLDTLNAEGAGAARRPRGPTLGSEAPAAPQDREEELLLAVGLRGRRGHLFGANFPARHTTP